MSWSWAVVAAFVTPAVIAVAVGISRLDAWQRIYAAALAVLIAGSSFSGYVASIAYYPRFLLIGLLALSTWIGQGVGVRLSQVPVVAKALVLALWSAAVVAAATTFWSVNWQETLGQAAALAALAFFVHGLVTRRWTAGRDVFRDLSIVFWAIGTSLVLGIVLFAIGYGEAFTRNGRFNGIYINPNRLSLLAALIAPLSVALFLRFRRVIYFGGAVLAAGTLLLTETRSAILALASAAVWMLFRGGIRTIVFFLYLAVAGVTVYLYSVAVLHLPSLHLLEGGVVDRFINPEGGQLLNHRTVGWGEALNQWSTHPIGGVGYGAAPSVFDRLIASGGLNVDFATIHSSYLQWFMETGLLGLVPLIALLIVSTVICLRVPRGRLEYEVLAGAIVVGLVAQLAESAMFGTGQPYPFAFWPVVAAVAISLDQKDNWSEDVLPVRAYRPMRVGSGLRAWPL